MMTPEQRVEELALFLDNFDTEGLSQEQLSEMIDILTARATELGKQLREA